MRAAGVSFVGSSKELKERIDSIRAVREYSDEAVILYFETNNAEYAIRKVEEMYKEYKEKGHYATVQSMQNDHDEITFKSILPLNCDIDNGEIYDKLSGKTIREL